MHFNVSQNHSNICLFLLLTTTTIAIFSVLLLPSLLNLMLLLILHYSLSIFFFCRTFVMGYGTAPNERLSTFVMIVACIGLGIPLALLVGGGCYICIKRVRNRWMNIFRWWRCHMAPKWSREKGCWWDWWEWRSDNGHEERGEEKQKRKKRHDTTQYNTKHIDMFSNMLVPFDRALHHAYIDGNIVNIICLFFFQIYV